MAVARVKVFSCFFVCAVAVSVLIAAKTCLAACGDGQCSARTRREVNDEKRPKIPLFLAQQLNEADSLEEMLDIIHPGAAAAPVLSEPVISRKSTTSTFARVKNAVSSIFGTRSGIPQDVVIEQRAPKPVSTKPAKCQPIVVPVSVPQPNEPNTWYLPECVFLEQCSGCCNSELYQCEPTKVEKVPVRVGVYHPQGYVRSEGREQILVVMEKHTKCKCDCKVKKEHCNALQRHESCECVCINNDERTKCLSSPKKLWDKSRCACSCKDTEDCTTGLEFDENICACVVRPQQSIATRIGTLTGDGRYETRHEETRKRRWGNGNSTRYTVVPSS